MSQRSTTYNNRTAGSLKVSTSLERIVACLQEQTDNDEVVVAALARLMRQGRLHRRVTALGAGQEKAA
ncbi:MAG: hypothetical protein V1806_13110 [Pseudomonadota bacterium]